MQLQEFNAKQLHVIKVFVEESVPFYIPIYQRKYNWTSENEVQQLISDLKQFQDEELYKLNSSYYLGNIIVKAEVDDISEAIKKYILIDGQQRLTTILLLIKTLKYFLIEINDHSPIDKFEQKLETLDNILFINRATSAGGESTLKIDNPESDSILNKIFRYSEDSKISDKAILDSNYYKNYQYFKENLNIENESDWQKWLDTLKKVKFVKVTLGMDDKEIAVFESINSKGLPLNTLDLIRNYLFLIAEKLNANEHLKSRINEILTTKLEPRFTKVKTGEKDEKKINRFFSAHIAKEKLEDYTKEKNILYKAYKLLLPINSTLEEFENALNKLERDVDTYNSLVTSSKEFIKTPITKDVSKTFLAQSKLELYLPLFLILQEKLFNEKITKEEFDQIFDLLDIHNISLAVANRKNSDNRFLFKYIEKCKGDIEYNSLLEYLTSNINNKSRLTTREEFIDGLENTKIYESNSKIALYILYRIENYLRGTSGENIEFKYSLEHVFPQSDKNWKENFDDVDFKNKHLHTIGNLTLVKNKLNSKLSNKKWSEKKVILKNESSLKINEEITNNENWNVFKDNNDITRRKDALLNYIDKIWKTSPMNNVVVSEDDHDENETLSLISKINKLSIVEAMKIVMYRRYGEYLTLNEIKDELIDLYDYVSDNEFDIDVSFSRDKISTGGWMTERLMNNQIDRVNKTERYQKPIFLKDEENKTWTIGPSIYEEMQN